MKRYNDASYPPTGSWDRRLKEPACEDLKPVEVLHKNDWFTVRKRGTYFTMEHHQQEVIVLPIVDHHAVVMIRAKRPVLADRTLELPAGCAERSEDAAHAAARELAEETGIVVDARRMVPMPPLATSPNRNPYLLYVFRVDITRKEFDQRSDHDDEVERVDLVPLQSIPRLIESGSLYVAVPIAVIGTYLLNRPNV